MVMMFGTSRRRRRVGICLDEVGERSSAREDAPVVRMVLVNMTEETNLVGTMLFAHLAGEIVWSRQTRVHLHTPSKPASLFHSSSCYSYICFFNLFFNFSFYSIRLTRLLQVLCDRIATPTTNRVNSTHTQSKRFVARRPRNL